MNYGVYKYVDKWKTVFRVLMLGQHWTDCQVIYSTYSKDSTSILYHSIEPNLWCILGLHTAWPELKRYKKVLSLLWHCVLLSIVKHWLEDEKPSTLIPTWVKCLAQGLGWNGVHFGFYFLSRLPVTLVICCAIIFVFHIWIAKGSTIVYEHDHEFFFKKKKGF